MMKRLAKTRDKRILGVCGGIAGYFGWNPTIVRILWLAWAMCYGTGLAAYIIAALILPGE